MKDIQFKDLLKELRRERNLTQEQLAREIHFSLSIVNKWECGKKLPSYEALQILARYFQISADYLLCLKEY